MISDQPHRLVETLEERFRELEIDFHRAYWDSQIEATPESERRRAELELELRRVKGDPDALAVVEGALQEDIHEPVLRRQLEVLRLSLLGNQMQEPQRELLVELSSAVESDFASFRPELDGRRVSDNEIDEILKSSNDQELRQRAWEASKEVGNLVADRVRELARVRNEMARDLGYADYYQMSLDLQEMPEEWLFDLMEQLEQLTDAPFRQWKDALDDRLRDRFLTEQLYSWHYADFFFQQTPPDGRVSLDPALQKLSPPELCDKTFGSWGIDLDSVMLGVISTCGRTSVSTPSVWTWTGPAMSGSLRMSCPVNGGLKSCCTSPVTRRTTSRSIRTFHTCSGDRRISS